MSAEIEGVPWQVQPYNAVYQAGTKTVVGFDGSFNSLSIATGDLSPGEYNLAKGNGSNNAIFSYITGKNFPSVEATDGKLKVLENDGTHIKGLFYFNGKSLITGGTLKITKGYFNITNWDWTGTDPMSAEIDGVPWQAITASYYGPISPSLANLRGSDGNGLIIGITSGSDFPVGVFDIYGSINDIGAVTNMTSGEIYNSTYMKLGQVKVLENDATHIKGLFYFNAKENVAVGTKKIRITKGYFNILK